MSLIQKLLSGCLLLGFSLSAQTSAPPNVYQLYGLPPGGCTVDTSVRKVVSASTYPAAPPPPPRPPRSSQVPPPPANVDSLRAVLSAAFATVRPAPADLPEVWLERRLHDNLFAFKPSAPADPVGLRDSLGKVLIPPRFRAVEAAGPEHFVGYGPRYANLYDLTGRALLPENTFVFVARAGGDRLVVQATTGYGVYDLATGRVTLPTVNDFVGYADGRGAKSYGVLRVVENRTSAYLLLADGGRLPLPTIGTRPHVAADGKVRIQRKGGNSLVDLNTLRDVGCRGKIAWSTVSREHDIHYVHQKDKRYGFLARQDGTLFFPDTVMYASPVRGTDLIRYRVYGGPDIENVPRHWADARYGLLDTLGNVVLKAGRYTKLNVLRHPYYLASEPRRGSGVIDVTDGRELTPFDYLEGSLLRSGDEMALGRRSDEENYVDLYTFPDGEFRWRDAGGYTLRKHTLGGRAVYESYGNGKSMLLDSVGNRLLTERVASISVAKNGLSVAVGGWDDKQVLDVNLQPLRKPTENATTPATPYVSERAVGGAGAFLRRSAEGENFLDAPAGRRTALPADLREIKSMRFGDRYILAGYDLFALADSGGNLLFGPVEGSLFDFYSPLGHATVAVRDGFADYVLPGGRLLFDGRFNGAGYERLGLYRLQRGRLTAIGDASGEIVIPLTGKSVRLRGGLIKVGDRFYFRDGTAVE